MLSRIAHCELHRFNLLVHRLSGKRRAELHARERL